MKTNIILVNENDEPRGEIGVLDAHLDEGMRHRAYTTILINDQHKILMTRRSLKKPLWPAFWDGSFSSHPRVDETLEQSCERRAFEELGIKTSNYQRLFSYSYQFRWNNVFSEYEINHILKAVYNGTIIPDPGEVAEWKWMTWEEMVTWMKQDPDSFAPWWTLAVEKISADVILSVA